MIFQSPKGKRCLHALLKHGKLFIDNTPPRDYSTFLSRRLDVAEHWMDITDIPDEGRSFTLDDQEIWLEGWKNFAMDIRPLVPLTGTFTVTLQDDGVLMRGALRGKVLTHCDRCAEEMPLDIDQPFDIFETPPLRGEEVLEPSLLRRVGRRLELDSGSMLWEEFVLALPVKPLCREDCTGLCPECGANLNAGLCACPVEPADPRLAALRGIKIAKKD